MNPDTLGRLVAWLTWAGLVLTGAGLLLLLAAGAAEVAR